MGVAPPPDNPPPGPVNAGFAPGPPVGSLCGFTIPTIRFKLGFNLPSGAFAFPPKLPIPKLPLGINCAQNNPADVSSGQPFGGGRTSNADPDPDLQEDNA